MPTPQLLSWLFWHQATDDLQVSKIDLAETFSASQPSKILGTRLVVGQA